MVLFDYFELKCMEKQKEHDFVAINEPMKAVPAAK